MFNTSNPTQSNNSVNFNQVPNSMPVSPKIDRIEKLEDKKKSIKIHNKLKHLLGNWFEGGTVAPKYYKFLWKYLVSFKNYFSRK
jgi:hypothetical protein